MKFKNSGNLILVLFVLTTTFTGCSAFRGPTQSINVACSEDNAILTINGIRYSSPSQIRVKRNRDVSIQAYKEGFIPYQQTVGHHFNATGALDAVGTLFFIVPCVGLFCPGAWSLDDTDIFISMYQK